MGFKLESSNSELSDSLLTLAATFFVDADACGMASGRRETRPPENHGDGILIS
jgi:hypothetical protein